MWGFIILCIYSDEDTDVKALIHSWISNVPETEQQVLAGYIEDYFYKALDWVLKQVYIYIPILSHDYNSSHTIQSHVLVD
jgi:hypothetical protein